MGISKKSQKRKQSDQETQSPMLKIIKDIMQREKHDPERANLIKKERQEGRKKKNYSVLNHKCDQRSCDSSSTDRCKPPRDSKMAQDLQQQIYNGQNHDLSQGVPFTGDKKESWWFWKDAVKKKKAADADTCSCVSCAFKKLIGSDYMCVACLVILFIICVAVGFFVVYKGVIPICATPQVHASDAAKKNELLKARRQFRSDGAANDGSGYERRKWSDVVTNPWRSLTAFSGTEFGDANLLDASFAEESRSDFSAALSRVLDKEKLSDTETSEKLREFYKRLIQTDARIKNLKKKTEGNTDTTTIEDLNVGSLRDRYKRTLMSVNEPSFYDTQSKDLDIENKKDLAKFSLFYPPFTAVNRDPVKSRIKRSDADIFSQEPAGIIIEKKKVMVQYAPFERKRNFPKCSHTPKDSKSHEKQLKHPFYKNSQRLDELLDQMLDRKIDRVLANPLDLEFLVRDGDKCKHSKPNSEAVTPPDINAQNQESLQETDVIEDALKLAVFNHTSQKLDSNPDNIPKLSEFKELTQDFSSDSKSSLLESDGLHNGYGEKSFFFRSTTARYDLLLSVSTIINSVNNDIRKMATQSNDHLFKRKLLQFSEKDVENLGYEDSKEVLADYSDSHDETDKGVERDKRSEALDETELKESNDKYVVPPSTYNTNWKGPMQLYPDELTLIMNQPSAHSSKVKVSSAMKEIAQHESNLDITDTEYVEDYLSNKYAKLAQAYSDYGVLLDKKEFVTNEKSSFGTESSEFQNKLNRVATLPRREENIKSYALKRRRNANLPVQIHSITVPVEAYTELSGGFNNSGLLNNNNDSNNPKSIPVTEKSENQLTNRAKRSLKSINVLESEDKKQGQEVVIKKANVTNFINPIRQTNISRSSGNQTFEGFGEILNSLSNWFFTLAIISGELGNTTLPGYSNVTQSKLPSIAEVNKKNITYPMYDGEMFENIGHRSRALLAFEENVTKNLMEANITNTNTDEKVTDLSHTDKIKIVDTSGSFPPTIMTATSATLAKLNYSNNVNLTNPILGTKQNRTVVKRAANSNLISWNNIYDDEYGVKIDYFDNELRGKHSAENNNFVKRSGHWINKKFQKLGERIRSGYNSRKNLRKTPNPRFLRSADEFRQTSQLQEDKSSNAKISPEEKDTEKSFDFATLKENMKQICREASKAMQKNKKINVRENKSSDGEATSLMQQLVKLMTDLVDFQVQQKTCAKLPPDLAEFLNWLTAPNNDDSNYNKINSMKNEANTNYNLFTKTDSPYESLPDLNTPFSREVHDDPKTEFGSALQAVRDLLLQYEEMNEEDKSKSIGVKQYLDDQVDFLTKQLLTYEYNLPPNIAKYFRKRAIPPRRKRQMGADPKSAKNPRKRPLRKRKHKFIKKTGVKRTKTTSGYYDSIATEGIRRKKSDSYNTEPSVTLETKSTCIEVVTIPSKVKA